MRTASAPAAVVYRYHDSFYVNLTNRCPNACSFCIKQKWAMKYRGNNLNLGGKEPSAEEVLAELDKAIKGFAPKEVVFCGYGEPTSALPVLLATGRELRRRLSAGTYRPFKIRLNTVGLGSLSNGRDITPELGEFLDSVHISLNTADPEQWLSLVNPRKEFADKGFAAVQDFIRCAARSVPETVVTAVEAPGVDTEAVGRKAKELGAIFRPRPYLDDYERA